MDVDPEATLRCWQVDLDIGGHTYTVPALPARDWLLALLRLPGGLAGPIPDVVPGLIPDEDLADQIADGRVPEEECTRAARDAVEAAAGMRWWSAIKLAHATPGSPIGGELIVQGVDAAAVSLGAYLSAAYRVATRNASEKDKGRIDSELAAPPVGLGEDAWDQDELNSQFATAMAATAGRR